MNRIRLSSTLLLVFVLLAASPLLFAQESKGEGEKEQVRTTSAMSEKVYRKLAEAQEQAEAEQFAQAKAILDALDQEKLTPYEKAQVYNFYGFIYYSQERYADSIKAYETVLQQPDIPEGLRDQTRYTIAQLYFTTEQWQKAINLIEQWLKTAQNPGPDPYILLGSAYYQLEQWPKMIAPIEKAMAIARERGTQIKEQWWLLLRVAYFEQKDFKKVTEILETLVNNWPKKEYWTQLSAMYGELGQEKRQLAAYWAAYDQGLLNRSNELVQLAQLFLQSDVPYKAGVILDKGLKAELVEKTANNYRLLSQAWALAAEDEKAIPALKVAASMSKDGDLDVRLAQSYLNLSKYDQCIQSAREGLRKGSVKREDSARIILGMCLYESRKYEDAKKAFRLAAKDKRSERTARQWVSFIEKEQERLRQLDEALRQARRERTKTAQAL
ncbi:MAG TPA: hypothetical protein ENK16_08165 [Chromatiales bacterium]|nr:hypothetical protein [Chromatiales bacterium]